MPSETHDVDACKPAMFRCRAAVQLPDGRCRVEGGDKTREERSREWHTRLCAADCAAISGAPREGGLMRCILDGESGDEGIVAEFYWDDCDRLYFDV